MRLLATVVERSADQCTKTNYPSHYIVIDRIVIQPVSKSYHVSLRLIDVLAGSYHFFVNGTAILRQRSADIFSSLITPLSLSTDLVPVRWAI